MRRATHGAMATDMQVRTEATGTETASPAAWRGPAITCALLAISTLAIWIVAPEAVRATFSGPGPLLRVGAVVVGFGLLSAIVGRVVPSRLLARVVVAVPVVAVTWWALSPYLGDDVVDEAFPVVAGASSTGDTAPAADAGDPVPVSPSDAPADAAAPTTASADAPTPPPAEPIALGGGSFHGLTGHRGAGTATVFELPDGSRVLRLEEFDVSNGPGLEVHLVPGADQRGPGGGVELADLKGNVGNQNYDVPPDLDLQGDWTVLIWCEPFTVEVANATADFG